MTVRDNFFAATKRLLAGRVGHRCSNPGCMRSTSGPALDANKVVSVGEASHITAAAPGGMRYDKSLTPEERSAETNGIWLCDLCASLIDKDEKRFTIEVPRKAARRKKSQRARRMAGAGRSSLSTMTTTIAHSRAPWACRLKITSMPLWRAWARRRNAISQPFVALRNSQHTRSRSI